MNGFEHRSTWIFLRGLVRESAHWDDFPCRFAENIPGSKALAIDLPGNGKYWQLRSPTTISSMMEFVRQEAVSACASDSRPLRPLFLFAISLGAMVALEWLRRYPSEVAGAVLVNTSLRSLSPFFQRLSWHAWPALLRIVCLKDIRERERAILELTSCQDRQQRLVDARVQAYAMHPISRMNFIRQLQAAAAYMPSTQPPKTPLLLLRSLGDRLVHPACSEAIAVNWKVRLETHPSAGHDLPLDDPEWVVQQTLDWLHSLGDRCSVCH